MLLHAVSVDAPRHLAMPVCTPPIAASTSTADSLDSLDPSYFRSRHAHYDNDETSSVSSHSSPSLSPVSSTSSQSLSDMANKSHSLLYRWMAWFLPSPPNLTHSKAYWILLYFAFNLTLTLYNKTVLIHFPFPYTLTAIHSLFGVLGTMYMNHIGSFHPPDLSRMDKIVILLFSFLYSVNIILSNASLRLVSVPFHQVVRSSAPIFTVTMSYFLLNVTTTQMKLVSLVPVMLGVALATYGEYDYTYSGLVLTLVGTFLAALKTICTNALQRPAVSPPTPHPPQAKTFTPFSIQSAANRMSPAHQKPLSFHPLALLACLSPLSFIQCISLAYFSGELHSVTVYSRTQSWSSFLILCLNGLLAFGLNVVSFSANNRIGPLGITVAANVKQVLTILCAVIMFNLKIGVVNGLGIALTLFGGAWYAWLGYLDKADPTKQKHAQ